MFCHLMAQTVFFIGLSLLDRRARRVLPEPQVHKVLQGHKDHRELQGHRVLLQPWPVHKDHRDQLEHRD